ncbi:MAG: M1 family metallopeptidase [Saprospiraceae bacterium]|nr:M1 family metallopeptidase [Saprospiraceae bacterium]
MKNIVFIITLILLFTVQVSAQSDRWQQRVNYVINVDFDVSKHQYKGKQQLTYYNNSPDTLTKVFYHLYLNAFQPYSAMDVRNRTIEDAQPNISDKILNLKPEEQGWIKINQLRCNGNKVEFFTEGTILEVTLKKPILPNSSALLEMEYDAQIPIQIRRNGRDNHEGIDYSMAQWYPKLCEYDNDGWHPNPYIGREFYGIWGDYDVTILIDKNYIVAAGGVLQNPTEVGNGYTNPNEMLNIPKGEKLTYHFKATNVHDFAWGADRDFVHKKITSKAGTVLHFFYQKNENTTSWDLLPQAMDEAEQYMNKNFGEYAYPEYYFVQGGDGGMEYPMLTLITGNRPLNSLVGVSVHEWMHSWYQMMLGTNESLYAWMDEGFTSYASERVMNYLASKGILIDRKPTENAFTNTYAGYLNLTLSGKEEPLTTHADFFQTNFAYSLASYVKGSVFLNQLEYIIGKENFDTGLLRYYNTWRFKHPTPNDLIRVFENQSGLILDWYKDFWVNTTYTIDYSVDSVYSVDDKTTIRLKRNQPMIMPIDLKVTYTNGKEKYFYIPLDLMRGEKPNEGKQKRKELPDWQCTNPTYDVIIDDDLDEISKVEIDPSMRMADVVRANNIYPQIESKK